MTIIHVLLCIALFIACYTDVRTRTIPVWLFPSVALIGSSVLLYIGLFGYWNIIGLACMFVPMFILAITGNFGGGDILMFAAVGLILGEDVAGYVFILASISTVFILFTRLRKKEYPIATFALVSYLIFLFVKTVLC